MVNRELETVRVACEGPARVLARDLGGFAKIRATSQSCSAFVRCCSQSGFRRPDCADAPAVPVERVHRVRVVREEGIEALLHAGGLPASVGQRRLSQPAAYDVEARPFWRAGWNAMGDACSFRFIDRRLRALKLLASLLLRAKPWFTATRWPFWAASTAWMA